MNWRNKVSNISVGDPVCYKASFLRSTGQTVGDAPFMRGEVQEIKGEGKVARAVVKWSEDYSSTVLLCNLSKVSERGILD